MILAQQVIPDASTIDAVGRLELTVIALIAMCVTVFLLTRLVSRSQATSEKAIQALAENTKALQKISDRNSDYQDQSLKEKEKTREVMSTASSGVAEMTRAISEMQRKLGQDIEGATDALRGKDGVLEVLKSSAVQLTGLTTQTQSVVETARVIIASLEQVKASMTSTDGEMKRQIEAIQNQLATLATTVQIIPEAVAKAETNIIAAIGKQPPVPSPPPTDETIASKPSFINGQEKEKENNVTPET